MALTIYISLLFLFLWCVGWGVRRYFFLRDKRRMEWESRSGGRVIARVEELGPGSVKKFWLICQKYRVDEVKLDQKLVKTRRELLEESLLADKDEHIVPRDSSGVYDQDSAFGFRVEVPEAVANMGEIYNLCIGRGTLTDEERFIINDHIMQTIIMLEQLPFPRHLRRVPEYAGGHHEKMNGNGYPRRLKKAEMSIPARIMAVADIFEALTADDRPYKKAKKLSESIRIMSFMKKDQHIDPDIFDLFLKSGVYKEYADKFLHPDQIDDVDLSQYLDAEGT